MEDINKTEIKEDINVLKEGIYINGHLIESGTSYSIEEE